MIHLVALALAGYADGNPMGSAHILSSLSPIHMFLD
jgi:hypothetical protein